MLTVNQISGFGGGSIRPLILKWISVYGTDTNATSYTQSMSLGDAVAADQTRYILVATHGCANTTAGQISSCSIDGNTATRLYQTGSAVGRPTELWYIQNNTITTGDVNVVTSTTQASFGMSVWNLVNPLSITPHDSNSLNQGAAANTVSLTVPSGGVGMALDSTNFNSGTISWTNATEQYEQVTQSSADQYVSGALTSQIGTFDVTATQESASAAHTTVVHSWAPM